MIPPIPTWPRIHRKGEFAEHKAVLEALYALAGGTSVLDLGCGEAHVTQRLRGATLVDSVVRMNPSVPVIQIDMRHAPLFQTITARRYNLLFMGDSIEHLRKTDAVLLLSDLKQYVDAIAIFTPVGPWHLDERSEHPDAHKSAWYPEEFSAAGWSVVEYPSYHRFEAGEQLGAFWAWKWMRGSATPSPEDVYAKAGIPLS